MKKMVNGSLVDMTTDEINRARDEATAASIAAIKTEAARRIIDRYPEWKQRNMIARGVELINIGAANWTETEQAEADALDASWAWIKSVRLASNALESREDLADIDIADDQYWSA